MPQIQFNIPEELDNELRHYMIDNKYITKADVIIDVLEMFFKKKTKIKKC